MIFQTLVSIFLGLLFSPFFSVLTDFSLELQDLCLIHSPAGDHQIYYQAVICGQKPPTNFEIDSLKQLGLIHLLVVSGAHFMFLSKTLRILSFNKIDIRIETIILISFAAFCGFQNTALRAIVQILLSHVNQKFRLFSSREMIILVSICFCLSLKPENLWTLSLPLSWAACLGLASSKSHLQQSLLCYVALLPLILPMGLVHPSSIALNSFVTPIVGFFIFPLSFASFFLPPLQFLGDWGWKSFLFATTQLNHWLSYPFEISLPNAPVWFIWGYPFFLNLFLITKKARLL